MRRYRISFFVLFFCIDISFSQQVNESLNIIIENFKNFEYAEVIRLSQNLLKNNNELNDDQLIEIYTMKGVSHYSFGEDDYARESFLEILKMDSSFTLDQNKISPKIITLFNQVKREYLKNLSEEIPEEKPLQIVRVDTVFVPQIVKDVESENKLKNSLIRSVVFPGVGHFYNGSETKGWILTSLSALSLTSIVYFIIDSNKKEKEYLQERDINLIEDKYDLYNFSNRMKNISIGSFAAVWLYSQIDLLFFTEGLDISKGVSFPSLKYSSDKGFALSFYVKF